MVTKNDVELGHRVQKLRKKAGLTQDQLSEKLKVSSKYVQFIERGKRKPSLKIVYKIARAFGKKVSELFPF